MRAHWHVTWLVSYDHCCISSTLARGWSAESFSAADTRKDEKDEKDTRLFPCVRSFKKPPRAVQLNQLYRYTAVILRSGRHKDARVLCHCFVCVYRRVCGRYSCQLHLWGPAGHLDLQRVWCGSWSNHRLLQPRSDYTIISTIRMSAVLSSTRKFNFTFGFMLCSYNWPKCFVHPTQQYTSLLLFWYHGTVIKSDGNGVKDI